jgi:hypothetical protein
MLMQWPTHSEWFRQLPDNSQWFGACYSHLGSGSCPTIVAARLAPPLRMAREDDDYLNCLCLIQAGRKVLRHVADTLYASRGLDPPGGGRGKGLAPCEDRGLGKAAASLPAAAKRPTPLAPAQGRGAPAQDHESEAWSPTNQHAGQYDPVMNAVFMCIYQYVQSKVPVTCSPVTDRDLLFSVLPCTENIYASWSSTKSVSKVFVNSPLRAAFVSQLLSLCHEPGYVPIHRCPTAGEAWDALSRPCAIWAQAPRTADRAVTNLSMGADSQVHSGSKDCWS